MIFSPAPMLSSVLNSQAAQRKKKTEQEQKNKPDNNPKHKKK